MGELVRLILMDCINNELIFNGTSSEELRTPHRFYTKYVSEIEKYTFFYIVLLHSIFLVVLYVM